MAISIDGTGTITGISVGGLNDSIITSSELANAAVTAAKLGTNSFVSYAIIADEKAYNVRGGTFTSGAWRTRDLNTEIADPDGIVSISSNEFTLAAGSYLIKWSAVAFRVHNHQTRLYDVTGTAQIQPGSSGLSGSADTMNNPSSGSARVTISANNTYRIEHRCNTTSTNQGFGEYVNLVADTNNVYTLVEIYKEA